MSKALLVIDLQNDYFPGGKFPLWNTDVVLQNIERAIEMANAHGVPVIHIKHVAKGVAPFFNEGTPGADIHPRILAAAPKAPIVVKEFADSFEKTMLEEKLTKLGVTELLVCGMMTQNCVTHGDLKGSGEVQRHDPAGLLHHGQRDSAPDRPTRRFDTGEAGAVERGAVTPLTSTCAFGRTPTSGRWPRRSSPICP
jgi:Isochorismatase family